MGDGNMSAGIGDRFFRILEKKTAKLQKEISFKKEAKKFSFRPKDIQARVKRIGGGYHGTKEEYASTVLAYWKKFGLKPDRVWYDLYCDGMDAYDPRFIPDPIYFRYIIPYFNHPASAPAFRTSASTISGFTGASTTKPCSICKGWFYIWKDY